MEEAFWWCDHMWLYFWEIWKNNNLPQIEKLCQVKVQMSPQSNLVNQWLLLNLFLGERNDLKTYILPKSTSAWVAQSRETQACHTMCSSTDCRMSFPGNSTSLMLFWTAQLIFVSVDLLGSSSCLCFFQAIWLVWISSRYLGVSESDFHQSCLFTNSQVGRNLVNLASLKDFLVFSWVVYLQV